MATIASSMHKDAISALQGFDKEQAESVIKTDDEVDRFNIYIMRQLGGAVRDPHLLREVGLDSPSGCLGYRLVTKSIERVGDHAARIAEKVKKLRRPPGSELVRKISGMSAFSNSLFEESVSALLGEDYEAAEKVIQEKESKIESLEDDVSQCALRERFSEDAVNLRLIAGSLRRIAGYSADIAEVALNLTVG
jgi:phosphate uptake regulator